MQENLLAGWRRAIAFSLMVTLTVMSFGLSQINAQKDPGFEVPSTDRRAEPVQTDAPSVVFTNATPININDAVGTTPGTGNPYPSNIPVSGLTGTITDVNVTLRGVTHTFPDDIDILLVSPSGKNLLLQGDAGGGTAVTGRTYTFDQQAATQISSTVVPAEGTSVRPGSYAGTGADTFPAPAPAPPYLNPGPEAGGTPGDLSSFNGDPANGNWSLYVVDDEALDTGSISMGWSIDITVGGTPCTYSFNPTSASIPAAGGTGSFMVVTQAGCAYAVTSQSSFITITSGGTGTGPGTVNFTVAANTGAARSGTITGNGQTFTVNQAAGGTPAPAAKPCFDFFGTTTGGRTSFATFQRITGGNIRWQLQNNGGTGSETVFFGTSATDFVTPGYFDTDNRADINVWRVGTTTNSQATYFLRPSTAPTTTVGIQFGRNDGTTAATNDTAGFEGDYDGDGRTDPTVVRNVSGTFNWFYLRSSNNTLGSVAFGASATDVLLSGGDYTGDGKDEIGVYRTGTGTDNFLLGDSTTGALVATQAWGEFNTDFVVIGDFVGDRRADYAVWRGFGATADAVWYIRENGGAGQIGYKWGLSGDLAVCGDYTGDGKSDVAVWRPSNQTYYWSAVSGTAAMGSQQFGVSGSTPVGALKVH